MNSNLRQTRWLLADVSNLVFSAHHRERTETPVETAEAFWRWTSEACAFVHATHVVLCFDVSKEIRRALVNRKFPTFVETPETGRVEANVRSGPAVRPRRSELEGVFKIIADNAHDRGVVRCEMPDGEADDAIGGLSRWIENQRGDSFIASGDGDLAQLVTPYVRVVAPRWRLWDMRAVEGRHGLAPDQLPQLSAMLGSFRAGLPAFVSTRSEAFRILADVPSREEWVARVADASHRSVPEVAPWLDRAFAFHSISCSSLPVLGRGLTYDELPAAARHGIDADANAAA